MREDVDPLQVRFTHGSISNHFRTGDSVDDLIERALQDQVDASATFPALELFRFPEGHPNLVPGRDTAETLFSLSN